MSYDVLIPYHEKDASILPYCIASVKQNAIGSQIIYVVSESNPDVEGITWIPEANLPFTKNDVATYIKHPPRVGWYFQQLIKLYAYEYLPSSAQNILILDSDVIIKKPVTFFTDDGKICFGTSGEHTEPYFVHMGKIIPGLKKMRAESGICHHIMTRRDHLRKILSDIEIAHAHAHTHIRPAWAIMLEFVLPEDYHRSGMADYEIYFNYCLQFFPDNYVVRPIVVDNLTNFGEFQASTADMVALHAWARVL
jgi:hypothetical protein